LGSQKNKVLLFKAVWRRYSISWVTVHNILHKNGLVKPQKRHKRVKPNLPYFYPLKSAMKILECRLQRKVSIMGHNKTCHTLAQLQTQKVDFYFASKGHYHENTKIIKAEFTGVFRI